MLLLMLFGTCVVIIFFAFGLFKNPKQQFHLKLSVFDGQFSALIFYAEQLDFFKDEGLKVDYTLFDAGVSSVKDLMEGNADLATGAEFVAVSYIEKSPDLRILYTISSGYVNSIIYDQSIDLSSAENKRIGLKVNSQADFFFQRFLIYNDLPADGFEIIDINPAEMLDKMITHEVDGVVVWDPFAFEIKNKLRGQYVSQSVQAHQDLYFLLFTKDQVLKVKDKKESIEAFTRALLKAETYSKKNSEDFKKFLEQRFEMPQEELNNTIENVDFSVSLPQVLLEAMEAEASWSIMSGNFESDTILNYLNYIEVDLLLSIDPKSVFLYR